VGVSKPVWPTRQATPTKMSGPLLLPFYGKSMKLHRSSFTALLSLPVNSRQALGEVREEAERWVFFVKYFLYYEKTPFSRPSLSGLAGSLQKKPS